MYKKKTVKIDMHMEYPNLMHHLGVDNKHCQL